ncbi:uncharacterized protein LOC115887352 [Sitophilus oryzae]|uniref:Uncharacterized protein LOC115887352 n=1 Tax=Sitophilus oryzae TaxID=7048 RepID=A0A6J2YIC1_SITOR|nr:uncharacterized protein LOC115887352 [Sitophilus oryzae]
MEEGDLLKYLNCTEVTRYHPEVEDMVEVMDLEEALAVVEDTEAEVTIITAEVVMAEVAEVDMVEADLTVITVVEEPEEEAALEEAEDMEGEEVTEEAAEVDMAAVGTRRDNDNLYIYYSYHFSIYILFNFINFQYKIVFDKCMYWILNRRWKPRVSHVNFELFKYLAPCFFGMCI